MVVAPATCDAENIAVENNDVAVVVVCIVVAAGVVISGGNLRWDCWLSWLGDEIVFRPAKLPPLDLKYYFLKME